MCSSIKKGLLELNDIIKNGKNKYFVIQIDFPFKLGMHKYLFGFQYSEFYFSEERNPFQ